MRITRHRSRQPGVVTVSTAVAIALSGAASAQGNDDQAGLQEVVVTATRQTSTVNRVPMSITALTPEGLEQSGVKNVQDLSRIVPSVTFRRGGNEGNPTIAIRGISSSIGAPTTALYLDDTPLQKRDNPGVNTGNGAPFPQLFDLERVEVLRGPQGTLYGGSAEGGAIRFISPQPSLTGYSGFARAEATYSQEGDPSYEGGIALGGPIVDDKLGFRLSLWQRQTGGYLDHVSIYDGHTIEENTNSGTASAARLAVSWEPLAGLRITPAIYWSEDKVDDHDVFWEDVPQYTVNSGYFTNRGTVNGVAYNFPDVLFTGGTFGPHDFGPYKSGFAYYVDEAGNAQIAKAPRTTRLTMPTLTVDYSLGNIAFKSITSYFTDSQKGYSSPGPSIRSPTVLPTTTNAQFVSIASHTAADVGTPVPGGVGNVPLAIPGFPSGRNFLRYDNGRDSFTQEFRLSSAPGEGKLSWVGGFFYSDANYEALSTGLSDTNDMSVFVRGVPEKWFIGAGNVYPEGYYTVRSIDVDERETALFGELNYLLTDRLTLTAGVRVSQVELELQQAIAGTTAGVPPGFVGTPGAPAVVTSVNQPNHAFPDQPGDDPFIRFGGTQKDTPVNPKLGLSWQATERNLFYATVAKGYRSGGINQPAPPTNCAADLAALGLTGVGTPLSYESDSVWSYEGGAKLRLFGDRAQINTSVYFIDWKDPQLAVRLRCGLTYVTNAGAATSKGVDVQAQFNLFRDFTLEGSVAYTKAEYSETFAIAGPNNTTSIVVAEGDPLGVPEWQGTIGAQYAFDIGSNGYPAYVRADFQYSGKFERGVGPGRVGYDPLIFDGDATRYLTARAGVDFGSWDLALFANNLNQSQDRLAEAHVAGYALVTAMTFRPREFGLQANYRF